jgi:hypothetical protein
MKGKMTAEEMEKLFDEGDGRYLEYVDLNNARRPGLDESVVTISLPDSMVQSLDSEA